MCPKCHSSRIDKTGIMFWIFMGVAWLASACVIRLKYIPIVLFIFGLLFIVSSPFLAKLYKCQKCSKIFVFKAE